jgi:hypothetical protein
MLKGLPASSGQARLASRGLSGKRDLRRAADAASDLQQDCLWLSCFCV